MEMVQSELEIFLIPESVCLPFESFDLVVDALNETIGDEVFEIVKESSLVGPQGLGHSCKLFDSDLHGISAPHIEKGHCALKIIRLSEEPQLLFHGMSDKERLIGMEQGVETGFPVRLKISVVFQKKEAIAIERLFPK